MIELTALLRAAGVNLSTKSNAVKVHLAVYNQIENPLEVFREGRFPEWQQNQGKKNFESDQVLSLIALPEKHRWLFAGVYAQRGRRPHPTQRGRFLYDLQLLPGQKHLIGRVVVQWDREGARISYRKLESMQNLFVESYSVAKVPFKPFPGWGQRWSLKWTELKSIEANHIDEWINPLANVFGVYLITDQCDEDCGGEQYVGIASGSRGIWGRWSTYAQTGHGHNKKLRALLRKKGLEHARNFLYTVLETAPTTISRVDLAEREQYWMNVLGSKAFGLNS